MLIRNGVPDIENYNNNMKIYFKQSYKQHYADTS